MDETGTSGTSTYLPENITNLAPEFVDAAAGDFHLAPTSPLIDAGDPAAPAPGRLDLDGDTRALASACGLAVRRDIGADEYAPTLTCQPPAEEAGPGTGEGTPGGPGTGGGTTEGTTNGGGTQTGGGNTTPPPPVPATTLKLKGKHRIQTTKAQAKVTVTIGSSVAGSTFRCRIDKGPYRPCAAKAKLRLKPGKHVVAAVASAGGMADPTPATVKVTVVSKAA